MAQVNHFKAKRVRLSFVHLDEPYGMDGDSNPKYQTQMLISKKDKASIEVVKAAYEFGMKAGREKFGQKWDKANITPLVRPEGSNRGILIDCDKDNRYKDDPNMAGHYMMGAKSTTPALCMAIEAGKRALDKEEIKKMLYSGCYANVKFNIYPYQTPSFGLAVGLEGVIKVADGDYLGGHVTTVSDFDEDFEEAYDDDDDDI